MSRGIQLDLTAYKFVIIFMIAFVLRTIAHFYTVLQSCGRDCVFIAALILLTPLLPNFLKSNPRSRVIGSTWR